MLQKQGSCSCGSRPARRGLQQQVVTRTALHKRGLVAAMAASSNGHTAAQAASTAGAADPAAAAAWQHSQYAANPLLCIPMGVMTDSYKASHFLQYPAAQKMVAYGEFRCGYGGDADDARLVVFGLRYILENHVLRRWTAEDVERADLFYRTHMSPAHGAFPFPKDLFMKFVNENDGFFPVKIQALPEGSCVHAHVPIYQITADGEYSSLCTFLETLLTMVWYPTTVATLSRRARDVITAAFEQSAAAGRDSPLLESRLHDFGFRGCTTVEQSVIGGCAHLLSFDGTDTMSAAFYAQFHLNGGRPVGMSIPATEHSVMTCWPSERAAIANMVEHFGTGAFATVMDSYNYSAALAEVVPSIKEVKEAAGGFWVLRPDSGDPVEAVLMALHALDRVFGSDVNAKGFKVLRGAGVIQGDGINITTLAKILDAVLADGFSAENVAFGMGGGLLQRVNRDTMSFATKLCHVVYADGSVADVMKHPSTDSSKMSFPGVLAVKRVGGVPTIFPADSGEVAPEDDMLQVIYDKGPVPGHSWQEFDGLRARIAAEWDALPLSANVVSDSLQAKIAAGLEHSKGGLQGSSGRATPAAAAAAPQAASGAPAGAAPAQQ